MELKQWMQENRWSNLRMAKELGIVHGTLSNVRLKKTVPSMLLAKCIVRFTGGDVGLADLGVEKK
jgi:ADP-dependent phosphofructokinase/glucokinase